MAKRQAKDRPAAPARRSSSLIDTRVIRCADRSEPQAPARGFLRRDASDRLYVWHRLLTGDPHSNRNYEVFWGDRTEPQAQARGFPANIDDRHASTQAYSECIRPCSSHSPLRCGNCSCRARNDR